jgi:Tol biopolymer transport system component
VSHAICVAIAIAGLIAVPSASATNPGPNGKIAFVKSNDIYSVNPDGSGLTQLTKTSTLDESSPAFSPDGNYIAFTRNAGLWVMRSDGTEQHLIASVSDSSSFAWSPDGSKLAFFRNLSSGHGIWTINVDGSGLTNLITDDAVRGGVTWSPDGTKLAFTRNEQIWTMNADGSGQTQLTSGPLLHFSPNWSPDGTKIAFAGCTDCSSEDIYTIPSTGGSATLLPGDPALLHSSDPNWSPDGTKIVFADCPDEVQCVNDLYVMSSDGSAATLLQGAPQDESQPDWQPAVGPPLPPIPNMLDKIAFVSTRDHGGIDYPQEIYTMNPDGTLQRALTDDEWYDDTPSWSPDGQKIAFASNLASVDYDVYAMNPDGTGRTNLTNTSGAGEGAAGWSPDGTKIVYSRDDSDNVRLWSMNADGSGQTQLTNGRRDLSPTWAPDGTKIAFSRAGAIYTINPDGTGLTPLTTPPTDGRDDAPDWSPHGDEIAFARFLPSGSGSVANVWTMNADGTGQHQLTIASTGAGDPSWSPDGTRIAFNRRSSDAVNGVDVFVMNADGTSPVDITNSPGDDTQPDWKGVSGYARPKGATPMRISLVPAAVPCTAPNRTHGSPLSFESCRPAALSSQYLTTGTPDVNGRPARMSAYLLLKVMPGDPSTPADEADVQITAHLNDVAKKDLTDYTGELRANLPIRITDRSNGVPSGGSPAGTTQPFAFGFDVPCVANLDPNVRSDCSLSTTIDALVPGAVRERLRSIWQVGQVRVFDGGADGDGSTAADNTVFLTQGLFVP